MTALDETARHYLLGELSPEQEEAFEQRFASDDAAFAEVEAVEEDLIDAYALGQLSATERARFEARLLASPGQRERVAFSRALAHAAEGTDAAAPRRARPAALTALPWAAVLLVATAGGVAAVREIRSANGAAAAARTREDGARQEIQSLQRRVDALEHAAAPPPAAEAVRWALRPGWERGTGPERALALGTAEWVRLDLVLEEPAQPQERFRLRVETPEGRVVATQDGLAAAPVNGRPTVAVLLPARLLLRGTYLVALSVTRAGATAARATYRLRVETTVSPYRE